ncbi:hypothetical protein TNCV_3701421 [Trichonephila clavipes]|nr:hypothetical protein TNCV_3701421 [Trichonephila clavipes]
MAPVLNARPSTALATPEPMSIPESPVQIPSEQISPLKIPATSLVQIPPELTTPLVQIPDPPVQIPVFQPPVQKAPVPTTPSVQLFLPDSPPVQILLPPVVESSEPTLTDDPSIIQIMSSVFGDCSKQGLPPAHTQEPQVLDTVPSLFV